MENLQPGWRVVIVQNPQPPHSAELFDAGMVVRVGEGGAVTDTEIVVASDFLKGKQVTLRRFPDFDGGLWRFFFEDPLTDPGQLVFSELGPTFSVEVTSQ